MTRVMVTGTGRSGTGYIARVLQLCGLEVGHEGVFGPLQALGEEPVKWWDLDGDSSWLALPLLQDHDGPRFLQVRHPFAAIASLVGTGLFGTDRSNYRRVVETHAAECLEHGTEVERAAAFWTTWNRRALIEVDSWWRVEDVDADVIATVAESIGRRVPDARTALEEVPRDYNGRTRVEIELPLGRVRDSVCDLACGFGYEV